MDQYKRLRRPFLKVFLGALFTYQLAYYGWERMRLEEIKEERREEVRLLEGELEGWRGRAGS